MGVGESVSKIIFVSVLITFLLVVHGFRTRRRNTATFLLSVTYLVLTSLLVVEALFWFEIINFELLSVKYASVRLDVMGYIFWGSQLVLLTLLVVLIVLLVRKCVEKIYGGKQT